MEKIFSIALDYSKEHGISATIPVFAWIVFKVAREDLNERIKDTKNTATKNHDDIEALEIELASLRATVAAIEKVIY
jgi:hypothetical protein